MKKQLKAIAAQLSQIDESEDITSAPFLLRQARHIALDHGNGDAARLCRMPHGLISIMEAREIVASMIGLCKEPESNTLTVKQAAASIKVSQDTVRQWIKSGELKASNVGKGRSKGRYVIQMNDWESFLDRRKTEPPVQRKRLNSSFKRY
jgi:excisionase family DNA binding protein